ncbi:MAG: L-histidine N(alpha)-methyltransferase [Streptosporangiaceae bacterium]
MEGVQILRRLERVIEETDFAWSLCLVGEDQSRKLADLINDLKRPVSATGDGKQVVSGYSYWGIEPTIAWQHACNDPYYPVMKDGIDSFGRRWRTVQALLGEQQYHYISLGPGTGEKDRTVLSYLEPHHPDMFYVPVDMSAEMLRICVQPMRLLSFIRQFRRQLLPVQLDFSVEENVEELATLREKLVGDESVLFSLLGNTVANFEDDVELIGRLSRLLLKPQDRLLLEVATVSDINAETARSAANEYERSKAFREFVTSSMHQHTDLPIDMDSVIFEGIEEGNRSILIKIIYRNQSGRDQGITLPDRTVVAFPENDTIRLHITRKYLRSALDAALKSAAHLSVEGAAHTDSVARGGVHRFGLDLILLSYGDTGGRPASPVRDLFRNSPR